MYIYVHMYVTICMHVYVKVRGWCQLFPFIAFCCVSLRQGCFLNPMFSDLACLSSELVLGSPCLFLGVKMTGMLPLSFSFYMGGGWWVSWLHSSCLCCKHFIHWSSPQPRAFYFTHKQCFLMGNNVRILQEACFNLLKISKSYLAVGWFPPGPIN